jgi:hypothetical protein
MLCSGPTNWPHLLAARSKGRKRFDQFFAGVPGRADRGAEVWISPAGPGLVCLVDHHRLRPSGLSKIFLGKIRICLTVGLSGGTAFIPIPSHGGGSPCVHFLDSLPL